MVAMQASVTFRHIHLDGLILAVWSRVTLDHNLACDSTSGSPVLQNTDSAFFTRKTDSAKNQLALNL